MIFKSYLVEKNINIIKKNLILLHGENIGLHNDFKNAIKLNYKETEIIRFTQEEVIKNPNQFFSEINNRSLFETKKVYLLDQANDKILELIKNIEKNLDQQKFYIFAGVLEKKSKLRNYFEKSEHTASVACYSDNEINIKKIVQEKLKHFEGLTDQNINIIIDSCNLDRVKLNNEIDKIIAYFTDKRLENNDLEKLLNIKVNEDFNLLKDEAFNGNKIKTNKLLGDTEMDEEKNILYLSIINQRLNKLAQANELTKTNNLENAISIIKPPIFWKDKNVFIMQTKKWGSNKIKTILDKTYNLEIEIKSNAMVNKKILMKKLLIDICELANAS